MKLERVGGGAVLTIFYAMVSTEGNEQGLWTTVWKARQPGSPGTRLLKAMAELGASPGRR